MNDPLAFLVDKMIDPAGNKVSIIEQPKLHCPCYGSGLLGCEWLYKREPQCTCSKQSDDWVYTMHDVDCDAVPCPFCPLENP